MNEDYNGGKIIKRGGQFYFARGNSEAGAFLTVASLKKHFPVTKTQADIDRAKKSEKNTEKTEVKKDFSEIDAKSEKINDELEPIAKENREKRAKKTAEVKNSAESPIVEIEAQND